MERFCLSPTGENALPDRLLLGTEQCCFKKCCKKYKKPGKKQCKKCPKR